MPEPPASFPLSPLPDWRTVLGDGNRLLRTAARNAGQNIEVDLRNIRSEDDGVSLAARVSEEISASVYGVALGLKPLYHAEWGPVARAVAEVLRQHALEGVRIRERDGHVYAYRENAVRGVIDQDPAVYPGDTLFEKIHAACVEGRNGELLGYGARTMEEGGTVYVIAPDGVAVFGFRSRAEVAQERAEMFAAIWSDLFGRDYIKLTSPAATVAQAPVRAPWYRGAYYQLAFSILLSTASQPLLKVGADQVHLVMEAAQAASWQTPVYFLMNGWAWLGISAQIVSLLSWVYALRSVQLNIAFNLTGIAHVLVPLASWIFLGEYVSPLRWAGILLVFLGVVITAQEARKLEEKL